MEGVASTLHTISEHGVSSITIADAHASAASNRQNWQTRRFKWTRPFRLKTKAGFCACAITFQMQSTLFFTRSVQLVFSIFLQHYVSEFSRCFWSISRSNPTSSIHKNSIQTAVPSYSW